jgi:uncharacterized protein with HEPN domain
MKDRDDTVFLQDILESIELVDQYIGEFSEYEFSKNLLVFDAVIRRFEIIGEAAHKTSKEFKSKYPEIEWQLMKDMRNKISHEYFGVSSETVYNTIKSDLPLLKEKIEKLMESL